MQNTGSLSIRHSRYFNKEVKGMLKLNGKEVAVKSFPDGTPLLKQEAPISGGEVVIDWRYEDDKELFALYALTRHLQKCGCEVALFMPYIPNARMDRVKGPEDVFTLKYFAEIINSLGFVRVTVLDPHSTVSEALIEHLQIVSPKKYIEDAIARIGASELLMFYPDEGAMKRYSEMIHAPYASGAKQRYWETGKLAGLRVVNGDDRIEGKDILIVDDICSRGGTFLLAAGALKDLGAERIYLFVTHCENTILQGEVLTGGLIEKVYTTDSICAVNHEKVEVICL